jgi:hypothetical protein
VKKSVACVQTENANRYLQQLCKHWSHKFEVTFDAGKGTIPFRPDASLDLIADGTTLTMTLTVGEDDDLTRMEGVVDDHLERFAFREELAIDWKPA